MTNGEKMDEKLIKRINELAKKAKETGLTEEETKERDTLRKEYIAEFRKNLRMSLENVDVEYPDGTVKPLTDLKKK